MLSLISLQEYLHFKAHQHHEIVFSPSFTLFLHPTDSGEDANYALPDPLGSTLLHREKGGREGGLLPMKVENRGGIGRDKSGPYQKTQ